MDHAQKLAFVHKMTKMGLDHVPHFDGGGVISAGSSGAGLLGGIAGGLTTQNGYQAQSPTDAGTIGKQQATLAGQLQTEAAGGGPNPAQQQYLQNANQIAQQQAGTYAANRALNPGLAARMAGNTAANVQQTAAGTAAIQQAEQQIAAQQQLQGLTGQEQAGLLGTEQINSGIAQNNANSVNGEQQSIFGSVVGGIPGLGKLFAEGGPVNSNRMADGGALAVPMAPTYNTGLPNYGIADNSAAVKSAGDNFNKAKSGVGQWINGMNPKPSTIGASQISPDIMAGGADSAAELSPAMAMVAKGGLMKEGGKVKAHDASEKAKIKGDNYDNDKIPAMLSEGELVIDRDTMQDPGVMGKMARALAMHIESKKKGKKS